MISNLIKYIYNYYLSIIGFLYLSAYCTAYLIKFSYNQKKIRFNSFLL